MGAFDDLATANAPVETGAFDDLIPKGVAPVPAGAFDDLIPKQSFVLSPRKIPRDGNELGAENATALLGMGDRLRQTFIDDTLSKAKTPEQIPLAERLITDRLTPDLPTPGTARQITRGIGMGLHDTGKVIGDVAKAYAFEGIGEPGLQMDQLTGKDPWEEGRKSLPLVPRAAAGAVSGLIETTPQLALAAVNPVAGGLSFGFTPEGFDPVQAGTMLLAPGGGKIIGNIAAKVAAKAGITSEAAQALIDRAGGAAGVAGLMSAPSIYQIAQMPAGEERNTAIEDTAANALVIGVMGAAGHRETQGKKPVTGETQAPAGAFDDLIPKAATAKDSQTPNVVSPAANVDTSVARTADGAVDPVTTALNKLRAESKPENAGSVSPEHESVAKTDPTVSQTPPNVPAGSTIAEKAAANPTATPTMADLAAMVQEIKAANPFAKNLETTVLPETDKITSEPVEIPAASKSSPADAATAPAAPLAADLTTAKPPSAPNGTVLEPSAGMKWQKQPNGNWHLLDTFGKPMKNHKASVWQVKALEEFHQRHAPPGTAKISQSPKLTESLKTESGQPARDDSQLFDTLVKDYGPQLDWASGDEAVYDPTLRDANNAGSSVPTRIKISADMEKLRRRAASDLIPNPSDRAQVETPQGRAALLPKLVEHLKARFPDDKSIDAKLKLADFKKREPEPSSAEQQQRAVEDARIVSRISAANPQSQELRGIRAAADRSAKAGGESAGVREPSGLQTAAGRDRSGAAAGVRQVAGHRNLSGQLGSRKTLRELERIFGVRIIPVESAEGGPVRFHGYKDKKSNVMLVDAHGAVSPLAIAGHELSHHLDLTAPGLYKQMVAKLQPLFQRIPEYAKRMAARGDAVNEETFNRELVGDFIGDCFTKPEFLDQLARREPEIFKRFARLAKTWLEKLIAKAKTVTGYGVDQHIADLEAARKIVADALARFAREQVTGVREEGGESRIEDGGAMSRKDFQPPNNLKELGDDEFEIVPRRAGASSVAAGKYGSRSTAGEQSFDVIGKKSGNAYYSPRNLEDANLLKQQLESAVARKDSSAEFFGGPESVSDQRIRLDREKLRADETKAKSAMLDKAGQGSLFSRKEHFGVGAEDDANRPERERSAAAVRAELDEAEDALKQATIRDPATQTQSEYKQAAALAGARYRTLRDELATHPDHVADLILQQHQAITEANELLKPAGMALTPEDFPNIHAVTEKIGAAKARRVNELADIAVNTQAELARTRRLTPKLADRVTNEMMADGRLPKMQELRPDAGRTLQAMTDALKKSDSDSPRASFLDRFNVAKKAAEKYAAGKDAVSRAWANSVSASKAIWSLFKSAPVSEQFKDVMKSWIGYDTRTGIENANYTKALLAKVPQKVRRAAMSVWLDAGGDESLLRFQRDSVPEKYREVWEAALKLTPDEKKFAGQIRENFGQKLDDGQAVGIIDQGRADYGVPQRWKVAPQIEAGDISGERHGKPGNPYAKLDPRDPFFSFQRTTPSYFDGIMAKGEPENLDIAHLVSVYDESFHKALSSRGAIKALSEATAQDGQPVVKLSGKADIRTGDQPGVFVDSKSLPKDAVAADGRPYQSVDHWALRGWKFAAKDSEGKPIMVRGDMLVHPDYVDFLRNELNTPRWTTRQAQGVEKIGRYALQTSSYLKASKFIGPFHIVTEALHASFHGVVPSVRGFDIDLKQPDQALLSRNMMIDMGRAREMYDDGVRSMGGGVWKHVHGLGDAIIRMNNFTFNEYIPRLKMKVGLAVLARNRRRYSKELSDDTIAEITGRQMDAAFGGQNWRLLGANKNVLAVTRLGLVAPDFLISRAKVIGQAFRPYNAEQRYFLLAQAVGVYALCRVLNSILSDDNDPHFEMRNWDSVVIGKRAYHARFIVSDAANLARDLFGFGSFGSHGIPFITGRLGVLPKMGIETLSGKDLFTGQNKDGLFHADNAALKAFSIVAKDIAEWMTPMGVDGFLPGAAAKGQTGLGSAIVTTVGVSSKKETATSQLYPLADDFNRQAGPAAERFAENRAAMSGRHSDYQRLDNLLAAGDMARAKDEYAALLSGGRSADNIRRRYNRFAPFTGNVTRESAFKASLTSDQRKLYDKAVDEHAARVQAFDTMLAGQK